MFPQESPERFPKKRTVATRIGALMLLGASGWGCADGGRGGEGAVHRTTVPTGTEIRMVLGRELGLRVSRPGDHFTARVARSVVVAGRQTVPVGAVARGRVVAVKESRGADATRILQLTFETIRVRGESSVLSARIVAVRPEVRTARAAGRGVTQIRAVAAAPAQLGTLIGGGRSDASVGTGVVLAAGSARAVLPRGSGMRVELIEPLRVRAR